MGRVFVVGIVTASLATAVLASLNAGSTHRLAEPARAAGTRPGGINSRSTALCPAPGDSLIGFSGGCFWGAEQAFRKVPGVVATAVGYSGGSSQFPSYELAHKTGQLETVLVEFNPKRTPVESLLKVFWTLPRARSSAAAPKSSYRATVWTYDSEDFAAATRSREAMEKTLHIKLSAQVVPAKPFYLAEEYHQQYNEKAGKDLCNVSPQG